MNDGSQRIRMAQYGTKHGHAPGVLQVMVDSPDVAVVGVYEPDSEWRRFLEESGKAPWSQVRWLDNKAEILEDPSIVAISSEGVPEESLGHTEEIIAAGKHAFYDKPAGDDYPRFERLVAMARERGLLIQLGYMFRKHDGFERIAEWARSGFLGHVFYIRGQMSVSVTEEEVKAAPQTAGLFFDLGCHMIDQVVWILGRPERVTSFLRHDAFGNTEYADNTLGVFEYDNSMAIVDIAGRGFGHLARRFEVNGTEGSVTMEPMEPADTLRLHLDEPKSEYPAGVSVIKLEARPRYVASLASFVKEIRGEKEPDRSLDHELLVQETFLRATGNIRDRVLP